MKKIPEDIAWILSVECPEQSKEAEIGDLWDEAGTSSGGINYGNEDEV